MMRLYAFLLRLYPRAFYERFGAEMLDVFAQAWSERSRRSALVFMLHEFGGLLVSIAVEHGRAGSLRGLFQRRYMPLWLLASSFMVAAFLSLQYWGYVIAPPATTIGAVQTVERAALVRFGEGYSFSVIPVQNTPNQVLIDFPPSQILPSLLDNLELAQSLDPVLIENLSAALAREKIEIGVPVEYPHEPKSCGETCFIPGVQIQSNGSLRISHPEMVVDGEVLDTGILFDLTPNEAAYYSYVLPVGYIVQGRDASGTPVIFAAIVGSAVSNDHYPYHELIFTHDPGGLMLRSHMRYYFDVAGIEGFNTLVITAFLFLPLLLLWLVIVIIVALIRFIGRGQRRFVA
jgi:hypothetical protein